MLIEKMSSSLVARLLPRLSTGARGAVRVAPAVRWLQVESATTSPLRRALLYLPGELYSHGLGCGLESLTAQLDIERTSAVPPHTPLIRAQHSEMIMLSDAASVYQKAMRMPAAVLLPRELPSHCNSTHPPRTVYALRLRPRTGWTGWVGPERGVGNACLGRWCQRMLSW